MPLFKNLATGDTQFGAQRETTLKADEPQSLEFPMPDGERQQVLLHVDFTEPARELLITAEGTATDADDEDDHIHIVRQTANQTDLRLTELPGPRVLLFVDSFYPGWSATVDGKEVPILPANDVFKAIVVPAGTSEVHFAFSSTRVTLGLALSGIAVVFAAAVFLSAACLHRRRAPIDPAFPS